MEAAPAADRDLGLWRAYAAAPSADLRRRLFEANLDFAHAVAARIRRDRPGSDLDIEDLRQYAAEGLLQAIDRFDPAQGTPFQAFAARRISGRVLDGVAGASERRRQAATRHRVRTERLRSLQPERSGDALDALADLAVELAIGFMLDEAGAVVGGEAPVSQTPNAYESLLWVQTVRRVKDALAALPEPEGDVVRRHYFEGLEFARIAEDLALSRGRVSQIHAAAMARLRKRLPKPDTLTLSAR
ncbi:RNA polymerase sigma factor [Brevundimonas intermedia]|uniref:RNA polymerase sigma factor n=1 Tax=Brevundimonas intermedia TaxID=74315 RepID=A0ABQ5TE00_9CAUL|nr:sigma-70 family RNA polymerase sigma factor [Brevundimonas intermedia]GLK50150.1 RNA polymerase sigma factor [Brevundimonas intermedia]